MHDIVYNPSKIFFQPMLFMYILYTAEFKLGKKFVFYKLIQIYI